MLHSAVILTEELQCVMKYGKVVAYQTQGPSSNLHVRHQIENKKLFLWRAPLCRSLTKIVRVKIKLPRKSFSKICHSVTQHKWCEKLDRNPHLRVLSMYVSISFSIHCYRGVTYYTFTTSLDKVKTIKRSIQHA